jgi:DNA polymerase-1
MHGDAGSRKTVVQALATVKDQRIAEALIPILEDEKITKVGQNIKYEWIVLKRYGIDLQGIEGDTMIASYLLNPTKHSHNLEELAREYLDRQVITYSDVAGSGAKAIPFCRVEVEKACRYSCEDADLTLLLANLLMPRIEADGFAELFNGVEIPLIEVLAAMEMNASVFLFTDAVTWAFMHADSARFAIYPSSSPLANYLPQTQNQ